MADSNNDCNGTESEKRLTFEGKTNAHIDQLVREKHNLDNEEFPVAARLLDEELTRTRNSGKASFDYRYVDLYNEKPMKVVTKVLIPVKDCPNVNFVGKLLGPGGAILRQLQEHTKCRMLILGRGSMRDKNKEEELRNSGELKYSHLSDTLHVEVSCVAPPSEAHSRMAFALRELHTLFLPEPAVEDFDYEAGPVRGDGRRPPMPAPSSKAKVLSILEKARHSMDFAPPPPPPRRFGPPPTRGFKDQAFEDDRNQWVNDYKHAPPAPASRFFPARAAPYTRP